MKISIRPATRGDIKDILAIHNKAIREGDLILDDTECSLGTETVWFNDHHRFVNGEWENTDIMEKII